MHTTIRNLGIASGLSKVCIDGAFTTSYERRFHKQTILCVKLNFLRFVLGYFWNFFRLCPLVLWFSDLPCASSKGGSWASHLPRSILKVFMMSPLSLLYASVGSFRLLSLSRYSIPAKISYSKNILITARLYNSRQAHRGLTEYHQKYVTTSVTQHMYSLPMFY